MPNLLTLRSRIERLERQLGTEEIDPIYFRDRSFRNPRWSWADMMGFYEIVEDRDPDRVAAAERRWKHREMYLMRYHPKEYKEMLVDPWVCRSPDKDSL